MATPKRSDTQRSIAVLDAKFANMQRDIAEIKDIMRGDYVRQDEFSPVKAVVFGLVAVIMIAVVGAIMTLVLRR